MGMFNKAGVTALRSSLLRYQPASLLTTELGVAARSTLYRRRLAAVHGCGCTAVRNSHRGFFTATAAAKKAEMTAQDDEQREVEEGDKQQQQRRNKGKEKAAAEKAAEEMASEEWSSSAFDRKKLNGIEDTLARLRDGTLRQYDDVFHFLPYANYNHSMVMLLGNHSAGKSTFINYLLGREVQRTGVAPTDDGFTIIQRGSKDSEDDGPTSLSDPRYQLQDLQKFGPHFAHRFRVKTRRLPPTSRVPPGLMIVDSPGMIDTPIHVRDRTSLEGQLRGYDFLAATRWFAARCDVILLVFDPANPGTTGETLDVLTKSLAGFEHKFLLVMNKVDMFDKATDFARAYGALCWNLSKVLEMKDIPRIYTTFVPVRVHGGESDSSVAKAAPAAAAAAEADAAAPETAGTIIANGAEAKLPTTPLDDANATAVVTQEFVRQRDEVVEELLRAPLRRLDNLITETEEGARRILLAGRVCNAIVWKYRERQVVAVLVPATLLCVAALLLSLGGFSTTMLSLAGMALLASGGTLYVSFMGLKKLEMELLENSDVIVDRLFIGREKTLDLQLRWKNAVKPEILDLAETSAVAERGVVASLPTFSPWGRKRIESVLKNDIPKLRLRVAEYKQHHVGNDVFSSSR
ncbi:hypothetical protein DQ04_08691020 [Trypanosoma grayi]|uniref:hypothetical protein n=1 Tax=Trypanosoma grayi TaxID=71804 RepID=UPI0004F405D5|nr:hypothetical protein DQ04_08691020 [Trypanosoma grayi]KEG07837.1 hypothetical protein DQ04_08691020 [Trypanosoma grayi]